MMRVNMSWPKGITRSPSVSRGPMRNTQSGIMPRAAMVLMKVMVMDRLMSPPRRMHQKLELVPPGLQPRMKRPRRNRVSVVINQPTKKEN